MAALHALFLLIAAVSCDPLPGRVPKVYNALITSNQNLEPSKAFPVYQPVLHDPFGFPYQPVYYGGNVLTNGLLPPPDFSKGAAPSATPRPPPAPPAGDPPAPPADSPEDSTSTETSEDSTSPAPPAPPASPPPEPKTESPIPLNEFGLPPQVLPLGPGNNGFNHIGPLTYTYPDYRFYNPYDYYSNFNYNYNPYLSLSPLYQPLPKFYNPYNIPRVSPPPAAASGAEGPSKEKDDSPPSEPNDLNLLNNAAKDPSIPDVPPPPLPEGGLKDDKAE